jgi:ABC-type glycerol-3-phosphate transport system substrate-binding protein
MKAFFAMGFGVLVAMSLLAWAIRPSMVHDGRTRLLWVIDDAPARRAQIALFNQLYPECELMIDPSTPDSPSKVIVQSLAGVGPDLFCAYEANQMLGFVNSGVAWDITDELPKFGIDIERDVWMAVAPTFMHEGRVYGFPANAGADAIWINKDLFDKAGVPYPEGSWTWEEFIPFAQRLAVRDERGRTQQFPLIFDWGIQLRMFIFQFGGRVYTPDGTRCIIDSPEAIAGVEMMHDLVFKHRLAPSGQEEAAIATQGGWGSGVITLFNGGKAAMAMGGRWWLMLMRGNKNLRLGAVEAPHGPKHVYFGYGKSIMINRNSPRREEALKFFEFMASEPYNQMINDQADAVCPVKKFAYTDRFLHNPEYPEEDYNEVWRDVLVPSLPEEVSIYINAQQASLMIGKQVDLVKTGQKSPADAMRTLAAEINEVIARNIAKNEVLREKYHAARAAAERP